MNPIAPRRSLLARSAMLLAPLVVLLPLLAGCGKPSTTATTYYCPMHPTYTSDRPGSCPICNMDLVARGESPAAHDHGAPPAAVEAGPHSCPMHPEIVAPHGGRCAKCGMDLEPAPGQSLSPQLWTCPMHPEVFSNEAGRCPQCKMDLVPRVPETATATPATHAVVEASAEGLRLAGVRTEPARREALARKVRAVGNVMADERRLYRVQTKISGWIEKLYVNFDGQYVGKGAPTVAIYSPELLASQQEYLIARQSAARFLASSLPEVRKGGEDLVAAARRRLELFDVPASLLEELERTGQPRRTVDLLSPAAGFVISKEALAGRQVEPGMELFTVADLSQVWVEGEFFESEARFVRLGQEATLSLPYDPSLRRRGEVSYIYPTFDPETRTLRVRFDLANRDLALRPGMFVDIDLAQQLPAGMVVPDLAVLDSGRERIVFVETGPGRFAPRAVEVLWRGDGKALLASGVEEGERVATRANFLLDSESRLRAALAALGSGSTSATPDPHAGHAGH